MSKCSYCWDKEAEVGSSYCDKCGKLLSIENRDEVAPVADAGKDATLIWDDCPQCAYKHLTAAYAALTAIDQVSSEVATDEVYAARAVIAIRESKTGYVGNLALAAGCLAMAECLSEERAVGYKAARMALGVKDVTPELWIGVPPPGAFAAAHFTEALRELPALADRIKVSEFVGPHGFHQGSLTASLDMLRKNIKYLADTYELGVTNAI